MLKRSITLKEGIPLAIGSIIGSGILFLPALTFLLAHNNLFYIWLIATFMCYPLLMMFSDIVKFVPNEAGLAGFVALGLGSKMEASVCLLFFGTVCIGMPISVYIVSAFAAHLFHLNMVWEYFIALLVIFFSILTNCLGLKLRSGVQMIVTVLLFLVAFLLIAFTFRDSSSFYHKLIHFHIGSYTKVHATLQAIIAAFWAYAGIENLTFMAGEFKSPEHDFKICAFIAVITCGILYTLLSLNYAALIPYDHIRVKLGLFDLANVGHRDYLSPIITCFAFLAVLINFNSWVNGVSRLVYSSAKKRILPSILSNLNSQHIPVYAIVFIGVVFSIALSFLFIFNQVLNHLLLIVSANFVFIYLLSIFSYLIYKKKFNKTTLATGTIGVFLLFSLGVNYWLIIYPAVLVLLGVLISLRGPTKEIRAR